MGNLAEAGILTATQGKQGGFQLSGAPENIFIREVVMVTEGLSSFQGCVLGFENCSDENPCALHDHWGGIQTKIQNMLTNYSLADLASRPVRKK